MKSMMLLQCSEYALPNEPIESIMKLAEQVLIETNELEEQGMNEGVYFKVTYGPFIECPFMIWQENPDLFEFCIGDLALFMSKQNLPKYDKIIH